MKTEKKTVQFSEDIQVETIEPEPEPVYIDEVRQQLAAWRVLTLMHICAPHRSEDYLLVLF